ncbi:reactive intermediate/imine deaminase [Halomonas ventosae]|uniref:Reactive intermediate/imine deaminase n=1 Tax=Halomonas ventosae TaxID=229007 RepID=A0A4R6ZII5_9GAMM|nr:RidA family protein [Halomonas ventosae]TDR52063.1 reactive intermediate/imine deaminase [Halomonas ventosae]
MSDSSQSDIVTVMTDRAPAPAGHYFQATVCGGMVHVSGQLPVRADGTHPPEASFGDQARQALDNLLAVVRVAGSSPERLLKVTAYIVGVENWPHFNSVFSEALGDIKPARAVVPVPELHHGYLVEVDAVAAVDSK